MAVQVTVVGVWPEGHEPEEEEVRALVEDEWLGVLTEYETEEV